MSGFGGWGYGFGGSTTTTVQTYVVGTLIVDIYDAKTKMLCGVAPARHGQ